MNGLIVVDALVLAELVALSPLRLADDGTLRADDAAAMLAPLQARHLSVSYAAHVVRRLLRLGLLTVRIVIDENGDPVSYLVIAE